MAIDNQFGKGIGVAAGFDLGAQKPLDARVAVNTIAERNAHVTENRAYEGMLVFVDETKLTYQLVNGEWKEFGFNQADFEESFADAIEETNDRLETLERLVVGGEGEGLNKVIGDVAANKTAIDKLNGGVDEEGSVAKAVADEASIREQADNSLANKIAAFEAGGTQDVAALANRVKANEDKLDGLEKETVQAAIDQAEADAKAHAEQKIADLVDSAPEAMDTLNELAKAIKDNKDVYDGYIAEHATAMATMKSELQAEIDADVKVEKDRAEGQEAAIRQEIAEADAAIRKEIAEADAAIRQEMAEAVAGVHKHDNKAVLDGINADKVAAWDGAQAAAEAKAAELDAALKVALQKEIDDDVKVVADALANEKKADVEGTLAKQIADVNARLNQNGDIENRIVQAESDIDGLQGLVGHPVQAGEGEEGDIPATGLHLALDNAKKELEQDILDEKERAEGTESDLQDAIDALKEFVGEEAHRDEELGTEVPASGLVKAIADNAAAIAAQPAIDQKQNDRLKELEDFKAAIDEESLGLANRIEALETKVGHDIDGESPATGLFLEVDQAKAAADAAQADVDAVEKRLDDEGGLVDRLEAVETFKQGHSHEGLQGEIDAVEGRVDALETFKNGHSHSVMEQGIADNKAAIEKLNGDANTAGSVAAAVKVVADELAKQKDAAQDGTLANQIADEKSRAEAAEKGLADRLDVIEGEGVGSIKKAIADLKSTHDSEMDAVEGRVGALEAKFEGDQSVDAKIAAAKQHAEDKDAALHTAIKGEMAQVVASLNVQIVDNSLQIGLGQGVDFVTLNQFKLDMVTDADINAIIAGLDEEPEQGE